MRARYHGYFKVESIRTQYSDYSSFNVVASMNLKNKLLNKNNWVENISFMSFTHILMLTTFSNIVYDTL